MPKSPRIGQDRETPSRHLERENEDLRMQLEESQRRLSASDREVQRQHDKIEEVTHGAQQTTQQLYGASLRIDELEAQYASNVQALQQQLRDRNEEVRHIQELYQTARVDSIAQLTQAQQVHEQMMCEYGTKIQMAHDTNANVT